VLSQYVILDRQTGLPIGLLQAVRPNLNSGYATLVVLLSARLRGSGIAIESVFQFIRHLFDTWRLRKLYCHVPDYSVPSIASILGPLLKEEGRLRGRIYSRGGIWDDLIFAIWREEFDEIKFRSHARRIVSRAPIDLDASGANPTPATLLRSPGTFERVQGVDEFMSGRRVRLVPVLPGHHEWLYKLSVQDEASFRWRYLGAQISREAFQAQLWPGVLCQFIVSTRKAGTPIGFVTAYQANLNIGYAYVGGMMAKDARRTGIGNEGFFLLFEYLRRTWNIQKLYFEFPEFNQSQFSRSLGGDLEEEVCLRSHVYFGGRYWNYQTFSYTFK